MRYAIHTLLSRAAHLMRNDLRPHLSAIGLSPGQPKVLRSLMAREPLSQRQLSYYCEVDPAAISRMLESMERDGLLMRTASATDRRTGEVRLTDKGRETFQLWEEQCSALEERMLQGFSREEREQLTGFLDRAYRNLGGHLL